MKQKLFLFAAGLALASGLMYSCSEDTPAPTAVIYATIDGYKVTFAPQVTDVNTYSWDFGDGSALSTEAAPVHTYASFGDYTVKLTVTGDGGETLATKVITIAATSVKDLLTGGSKATNGKTWVLSSTASVGFDGGGPIMNSPYQLAVPAPDNVLTMFGLGAEYDNEYTFYFDGTYKMNLKNAEALAGLVFSYGMGLTITAESWDVGMGSVQYSVPASATWTLNTSNLVIDAITDPNDPNTPPAHANVTITGKNWIKINTEGAYFGILDFPTTAQFVIDEITSTKMKVSMFLCGWSGEVPGHPEYNMMPSNMIHLTFIPK